MIIEIAFEVRNRSCNWMMKALNFKKLPLLFHVHLSNHQFFVSYSIIALIGGLGNFCLLGKHCKNKTCVRLELQAMEAVELGCLLRSGFEQPQYNSWNIPLFWLSSPALPFWKRSYTWSLIWFLLNLLQPPAALGTWVPHKKVSATPRSFVMR